MVGSFKKFIRGGQAQIHEINMVREYLKTVYLFGIPLFGVIYLGICYIRMDKYLWNYIIGYYKAKWFAMTWHAKQHVEFVGIFNGVPRMMQGTAVKISTNPHVIKIKNIGLNILYENLLYAVIVFVVCVIGIIYLSRKRGDKLHEAEYIRGATLISNKELKREIKKLNKTSRHDENIELAGIPMPMTAHFLSHLIIGAPGTGKTIILFDLVEQLIANGDKVLIYDMKGTFASIFYNPKRDILLNPFDVRSRGWNVFEEAKTKADFENIAHALIPHTKDSSDPFWTEGARILFRELCHKLYESGQETKKLPTMKQLNVLIHKESTKDIGKYLQGTNAASIFDEEPEKHTKGIIAVLSVLAGFLHYLDDEKESFSINQWMTNESDIGNLYITSGRYHKSIRPLLTTWIDIAINSVLQLEVKKANKKKIWFILDELPSLNKLPNLSYGMEVLREYGCSFVIATQSISKLQEIYHDKGVEVLSGVANTKVVLRNTSQKSAEWCSDILGSQEVRQYEESYSMGAHQLRDGVNVRKQLVTRKLVLPWEIMALKKTDSYSLGYISYAGFPASQIKVDFKHYPQEYPAYIEDIEKHYKKPQEYKEEMKKEDEKAAEQFISDLEKAEKKAKEKAEKQDDQVNLPKNTDLNQGDDKEEVVGSSEIERKKPNNKTEDFDNKINNKDETLVDEEIFNKVEMYEEKMKKKAKEQEKPINMHEI